MNPETVDKLVTLKPHRFSRGAREWRRTSRGSRDDIELSPPSSICVLTWNIDFMTEYPKTRMFRALEYIQNDIFNCKDGQKPPPCCLLFQEIHYYAFPIILDYPWVQKYFTVAPASADDFPIPHYGVVTLVSKSIPVSLVQSLHFGNSYMGRNALMVDLKLSPPGSRQKDRNGEGSRSSGESERSFTSRYLTLRLANTHLESLPVGAYARPVQLANIAAYLNQEDLVGGVVCGDMNIIGPSDLYIHEQAGLLDAWNGEDEEEGYTWGYQPPSQFPPGRLDRVFYTQACAMNCKVSRPERVGIDVMAEGEWVSDHYGLLTTISILDETQ